MERDAQEYDRARIEHHELNKKLKNQPKRLTDRWLWDASDETLIAYQRLWMLEYSLFDAGAAGNRVQRVSAEIKRRLKRHREAVEHVLPGWGQSERAIEILTGKK